MITPIEGAVLYDDIRTIGDTSCFVYAGNAVINSYHSSYVKFIKVGINNSFTQHPLEQSELIDCTDMTDQQTVRLAIQKFDETLAKLEAYTPET